MPTMERIPISEWEQHAAYSFQFHTHANATRPATAALAKMKNDDNDNIAPTVSECRSDIDYPTTAQPDADDTPQRPDDTNSSAAACPVANTLRSTTSSSDDDDEEDSDEEIGAMIYASSKTARARRAAAEAEPVQINNSNQSPSYYYEPRSEVRKGKILSASSSKEMASAPKKKHILKSFEQRMDDLRAYKEKHGHVNVKKRDDKSLYDFCIQMRRAHNNPEKSNMLINEERIASLDALGFDWSVTVSEQKTKKTFDQRIEDLRAYKKKHGHIRVKQRDDKSLYEFCYNIRKVGKNPEKSTDRKLALTDDRIASLDALGFDWGYTKVVKSFAQRIDDLRAYKEKHRHVNVKGKEDKSLYLFCGNMRLARNRPEKSTVVLTDDRIASLDALGFDWRAAVEAASVVNNSNQSPSSYEPRSEVGKRKSLSLSNSSSNSEEMESAPKKKRILKSFEQRMDDLRAYKEKHGHINVKKSDDKSLHNFCRHIRRARKNPEKSTVAITDDRITSLDALGFNWTVKKKAATKSFEERIESLRAYKEKNGHVNVKGNEDMSLYNFCTNMRQARNNPDAGRRKLTAKDIASLDALGFDWSVSEQQAAKKSFEQRMDDLRAYKEKHGNLNIKWSEEKSLYEFCYNMRHARKNSEKSKTLINEERISSLDALGFDWRMS